MLRPCFVAGMVSIGLSVLGAGVVSSQDFPSKPIHIVTTGVASGSDILARLIGQGISGPLGQPVIVDNRGGGVIPAELVGKAQPDGHTLLLMGDSFVYGPLLRAKSTLPYDVVRDFSPITFVSKEPSVLLVHPSLPVKSVKELIALAKARPGELNIASGSGPGSSSTLAGELFKSIAGVNIVLIPYKTSPQGVADLIAGHVQLRIQGIAQVMPHIKAGRLRALAITSAQPSALFPGLPTVAATVPGYEWVGMSGIWAPAKTPAATINRLNLEIVRVLNQADVKQKILNAGQDIVGSSPGELAAWMKAAMAAVGKVIKDAGITAD